jgi:hypothetical protein
MAGALDMLADADALIISAEGFGEPVTLPNGLLRHGVFELFDPRIDADPSEVGRPMRPSQQPNPVLYLRDADAASIYEGLVLTLRGALWRVTRLDPDGHGMTTVALAPAQPVAPDDDFKRWR